MLKRTILFLSVTVMLLAASCGASSPQSGYASVMEPAVEQLAKWQAHYADFESLLTDPNAAPNGMSRIEMIELYNMATEYKISREDYVSLGFLPLDVLIGDGNKFAQEGRRLEEILLSATPDEEIQAAHEAVLKCVQIRDDFAEGLASSLKDLSAVDLSADVSICNTFDGDLQTLTTYVNEHK